VLSDFIYHTTIKGRREKILEEHIKDSGYWRDVGNLDSYWNAKMDLCGVDPYFNLYGEIWPIRTHMRQFPPAKFVFAGEKENPPRVGKVLESLFSQGCIISDLVRNSVLSPNVVVHSYAQVDESVIMDDVIISRHCRIRKAIIDKANDIPEGTIIGYNPAEDRKRFTVSERGIVAVAKGHFKGQ